MVLTEILGIISVAFLSIIIVLVLILFLKKEKGLDVTKQFDDLEGSLIKEVEDIKNVMTASLFDSMLKFNTDVNKQLLETTEKSGANITEFRINVNNALTEFQTKINQQLTLDFQGLHNGINEKMLQINQKVEERLSQGFKETNQTFIQIAERVRVIDEAQKKIEGLSNEMISLQNILSNNQARGAFGEYQLNQILFSIYGENPKLYQTQYTIKEQRGKQESVRADAVVFMPEPNGMIAIDSKFPFSEYSKLYENKELSKEDEEKLISAFGADVKKHITAISNKYIIPSVTADYAIMFVASDGILALLHSKLLNVVEYARSKYVTIVSPTTLIPLLSSFKAVIYDHERSKYANEIIQQLKMLNKEFRIFGGEWNKLNTNIQSLTKQSDTVNIRVDKITSKFETIENVDFLEDNEISQ